MANEVVIWTEYVGHGPETGMGQGIAPLLETTQILRGDEHV